MKCKTEELIQAIKRVQPGLASKDIIEQSQSVVFKQGKLITYNDEVAVITKADFGFEGAIRGDVLSAVLEKVAAEDLDVSVKGDELIIRSGKSRTGITMSKEISLPYKEIGKTPKYHPLPKDFSDALRMVQFSAGTDMTRPVLACIHSDGNIMESCDRFRATRVFMKSELAESFLLPARFVPDLLKYEFSKYGFSKSGGWLHFKTRDGKTMVACRVYQEAEYPNLDSLFSKKGLTGKFKFPDKTSEILERAGVFSESEFAQDEAVTVTINKGQMQVEGKGLHGWHKERSSIKHKGKPIKFSVHPAFLSDCLKLIDVADVGDNRLLMDSKTMKHAVYLMSVEE